MYGKSASTSVVSLKFSSTRRYPSFCISSLQYCCNVKASDSDTDDRHFNAVDFESRLVENGVEMESSSLRSLKGDPLVSLDFFENPMAHPRMKVQVLGSLKLPLAKNNFGEKSVAKYDF